jgi:serine/threonine protein kinase
MTPASPDELRQLLVTELNAISDSDWLSVCGPTMDVAAILEKLGQVPRCKRHNGVLPLVTAYQRKVICAGRSETLRLHVEGRPWLLLEPLGKGGLGEVFVGSPISCGKSAAELVAIKRPRHGKPGALRALCAEIDALRGLGHPNVAKLLAADRVAGCLVTRLVDGPSLEAILGRQRRFPVATTVQIGIQVGHGLAALHGTGLIHKDVKPANIIREGEAGVVLVDFGLAQDPMEGAMRRGGTPYFVAPEIFFDLPNVNHRADIYGLGATLYCLLTGRPPRFQHFLPLQDRDSQRRSLDEIRFRVVDSPLDCDVAALRPDLPHALSDLIVRCLRLDPNERPATADEVCDKLEAIGNQIVRIAQVEHDLQRLSTLLIEFYRGAARETDWSDCDQNARSLRDNVRNAVSKFAGLDELRSTPHMFMGTDAESLLHHRTIGLLEKIDALCRCFELVGSLPTESAKKKALLVTALDESRDVGVMALALAHGWLTLMQLLGCPPLPLSTH